MMNPNRIVNIYSFHAPEEYTIPGTDVVVRCGRSTIVREEKTYILTSGNDVYGKFSIN